MLYGLNRKKVLEKWKKLLQECENKHILHMVVYIKIMWERITCSYVQVRLEQFLVI
jgi:hypothetical protein